MSTKTTSIQPLPLFSAALLLSAGSAFAQSAACSPLATHQATPAGVAYQEAKYESAESLYQQALLQKPNDPDLNIALVPTLLHESRISDAATRANEAVADDPRSGGALTALAGTDVFAPYLITLNFPEAKREVEPLPRLAVELKSALPGDRSFARDADPGGRPAMQCAAHQRRTQRPSRCRNGVHPDRAEYARIVRAS